MRNPIPLETDEGRVVVVFDEPSDAALCADVMGQLSITYRQLDYWTTQGYLQAEKANPGSGRRREWSESELRVARAIVKLTDAGFVLSRAAEVAREFVETGQPLVELAPGIFLDMEPEMAL